MNWGLVRRIFLIGVILVLPAAAFAQEATLTGTVTDSSGAVLPGVTITASNDATGNKFVGVSDERGTYRVAVRVGTSRVAGALQGSWPASRPGFLLLVGQTASLNLQLSPSTVQETV